MNTHNNETLLRVHTFKRNTLSQDVFVIVLSHDSIIGYFNGNQTMDLIK